MGQLGRSRALEMQWSIMAEAYLQAFQAMIRK
jgi:hypothetical protein